MWRVVEATALVVVVVVVGANVSPCPRSVISNDFIVLDIITVDSLFIFLNSKTVSESIRVVLKDTDGGQLQRRRVRLFRGVFPFVS